MIFLILALVAAAPVGPILNPKAACRLASSDHIPADKSYSVHGTYLGATHGAEIELPKCDATIVPTLSGNAAASVSAWHQAYRAKCGVWLHGEFIRGEFTGTFVRKSLRVPLTDMTTMTELFMVTEITSPDLDITSIRCAPPESSSGEH